MRWGKGRIPSASFSLDTEMVLLTGGANVGYLTLASRRKEVISIGDALVKSEQSSVRLVLPSSSNAHFSLLAADRLIPSTASWLSPPP